MNNNKYNFIVNLHAGHGIARRNTHKLIDYCQKHSVEFAVHNTTKRSHATLITRSIVASGGGIIIAVGGDGTFHEVINGIDDYANTKVGFIPSGRGNDFAKCMGFSLNPIIAFEAILQGKIRKIDYIDVNGIKCLNTCGGGIEVDVLEKVDDQMGKISYLLSVLHCIKNFKSYDVELELDGQVLPYQCLTIGVCNGKFIGDGLMVSPQSQVDDGLMNVIVCKHIEGRKLLPMLAQFGKGKHIDKDYCEQYKCKSARITVRNKGTIQLDGELYPSNVLDCNLIEGGITTFDIRQDN